MTQEAFNQFLRRLNSDRECAGVEYETLRLTLIAFFEQHGGLSPADLTDETFNRVGRILSEGKRIEHLNSYTLAVARNVLRENYRSPQRGETAIGELLPNQTPSLNPDELQKEQERSHQEESRLECLKKCLQELSSDDNKLIRLYHVPEDIRRKEQRKKLAEELGISLNALRIRIHHLKVTLKVCLNKCLGKLV